MFRVITLIAAAFALFPFSSQAAPFEMYGDNTLNPASVETFTGKVITFEDAVLFSGNTPGTHLLLRTAEDVDVTIVLGPRWFLEREGIDIPTNTRIEVEGYVQHTGATTTLIANRIKVLDSGKEFILRDKQGLPVWRNLNAPTNQ